MKFKYWRIAQVTKRNGDTVFMVQAAKNIFCAVLGIWHQFEEECSNADQAVFYMNRLHTNSPKESKVVYSSSTTQLIIVNGK